MEIPVNKLDGGWDMSAQNHDSAIPVLRQNAIMVRSLQKQPPKDCSLGPSLRTSVSGP
jgi:hypothetical protein